MNCRRIIIILFAGSLLTGCAQSAPALEPISLKLNWQHGTTFIGFYMAQTQGYYAEEGLDVAIEPLTDPSLSAEIPAQVLKGDYEFGVAASDLGRAQGEGLKLVAISNIFKLSPGAFFARKDSGIVTPADFAGRRIVVKSQSWQELLEAFLSRGGLTIDDVEVVPGGYDMTPFFEGEVEVWAGFLTEEVVRARLRGIDLVTFPNHEYLAHGRSVFIFAKQTLVQDNPDLAIRFLRASLRGWQFAIDNPSLAVDEMLAFLPDLDEDRVFYIASFESAIPLIIPSGVQLGEVDCPTWIARKELSAQESASDFCTADIFAAATQ